MRMKKILFSLISVMVFMPFLVSCDELGEISSEKDDTEQTEDENGNGGEENVPGGEDEPPYIILLTEIYPLASDAQVLTVMFETNVDWKVEVDSDIDWLSVSPSEGVAGQNEVTVQVSENEGYDERNAKVTVYYGDRQETFVIYQNQKNAMILSESKVEMPVGGGTFEVKVDANVDVTVSNSDGDWLHHVGTKGLVTNVFTFTVDPSELPDSRQAEIFVRGADMQETVNVYQAGEEVFVLSEKSIVVPSSASELKIDVRSNVDFTFNIDCTWLREQNTRSISSVTKTFVVDENAGYDAREAKIVFTTSKGKNETVTVTQAQKDAIVLAKTEYDVPSAGGLLEFNVASNVDFEVDCQADWISRVQTKGLTDRLVSFDVQSNDIENSSSREAIITFSKDGVSQQVTVRQAASSRRKIHIAQAGTLNTLVTVDELKALTELTLTGEMNQDDVDMLTASEGMFEGDDYVKIAGTFVDDSYMIRKLDVCGVTFEDNTLDGFTLTNLEEVVLPESIEILGPHAFEFCWKLKQIDLSALPALHSILGDGATSSVFRTMLSHGAFRGCMQLQNVTIPSTVRTFTTGAFAYCTNLSKIEFAEPAQVETFELSYSVINDGLGTVGDRPAPRLYYGMFEGCTSLKTFTIPSSVTRIQHDTFRNCPVESLVIPESVRIFDGNSLFAGCANLKSVTLPSYVSEINDNMFSGCSSLEELVLSSAIAKVGESSFKGCEKLREFDFESMIEIGNNAFEGTGIESFKAPVNMTELPKGIFRNCVKLKSIDLEGVRSLGAFSFYGCNALTEVTFPETLGDIESSAFAYCASLSKVVFEAENINFLHSSNHPPFMETAVKELVIPAKVKSIVAAQPFPTVERVTFESGSSCEKYGLNTPLISEISLPEGLKELSIGTFANCANLKSVVLPEGLLAIGEYCFSESAVETLDLPASLSELGVHALAGMSFKSFTVPETVKHIRKGCFYDCTKLETLNLPTSLESFGLTVDGTYTRYGVLENTLVTELVLHGKNLTIGESICPQYLRKLVIGKDVKSITTAIWNETGEWITDIYSPLQGSSIYKIDYEEGSALESVLGLYYKSPVQTVDNLPESLKNIGEYTFAYCDNLVKVVIPEGVISLGDYCFRNDAKLREVVFPTTLVELGRNCFENCTSLPDNFPLPPSLKSVGSGVFSGCKFKTMTVPEEWTEIPAYLFSGSAISSVVIPETVKAVGESAFRGCSALTSVELKNITEIGRSAFENCYNLKSVSLSGVERIEPETFMNCTSLTGVNMADVRSIGVDAFYGCSSLTTLSLPNTLEKIYSCIGGTGIREFYLNGAETLYADLSGLELERLVISKNIRHLDGSIAYTGIAGEPGVSEETGDGADLTVEFESGSQLETFGTFFDSSWIKELTLPATITTIGHGTFTQSTIENLYMRATVPPVLTGMLRPNSFWQGKFRIYVPTSSVSAYKTAEMWSEFADIIYPYEF